MKYLLVMLVIVMRNKLWFLTKMSLNKKIKTKWFLIANLIFAILIVGVINIDFVIKAFGGDFNEKEEILVIDEVRVFSQFKDNYMNGSKYLQDDDDVEILEYEGSYDEGVKEVEEDGNKILLVVSQDDENFIKAKVVSKDGLAVMTEALIKSSLGAVRSEIVLGEYNITREEFDNINNSVALDEEVISDSKIDDDMTVSTVMQIFTLPIFMLIIFLVQMIGAEVNEEKTTRSMEIIISNVSPEVHFASKIIASNLFVVIQGALLIGFALVGVLIRYFVSGGNLIGDMGADIASLTSSIDLTNISHTLSYMIPIMVVVMLLTFLAYSLLAGILASMTTNLEDFQQLQTPIVVISLIGYYLSMMAGMFKGSIFIKIMCYVPFVSSLLAPTMYVMGEITLFDLFGSVILLVLMIFILIRYGIRIYKAGILNYSGVGLWKKMAKAVKEK